MRDIVLPPVLAKKVERIAAEKKLSVEDALLFLVEKVCTPSNFLPSKVYTPSTQPAAK